MRIPLLQASDIDCRVQSITKQGGAILLLYKDARVDMRILDQVFGIDGWQRTHEVIDGNLYCNIDIWSDEKKCWIRKQDVGIESNIEKEKGQASDAFKRTGFNIGIGRELYTAPFIYVNLNKDELTQDNKLKSTVKFIVNHIAYNNKREIAELTIVDNKGIIRYRLESKKQDKAKSQQEQPNDPGQTKNNNAKNNDPINPEQILQLIELATLKGVQITAIEQGYGKKSNNLPKTNLKNQ